MSLSPLTLLGLGTRRSSLGSAITARGVVTRSMNAASRVVALIPTLPKRKMGRRVRQIRKRRQMSLLRVIMTMRWLRTCSTTSSLPSRALRLGIRTFAMKCTTQGRLVICRHTARISLTSSHSTHRSPLLLRMGGLFLQSRAGRFWSPLRTVIPHLVYACAMHSSLLVSRLRSFRSVGSIRWAIQLSSRTAHVLFVIPTESNCVDCPLGFWAVSGPAEG